MKTSALRQQLHNYLEVADDKKVKALYSIMESDIRESGVVYTPELKKELELRLSKYESGKATIVTSKESKRRIQNKLKGLRKK